MQVNVHEAKTQLSRLLELVESGEKVIIARQGQPVAELVPVKRRKGLPLGIAKDAPLVSDGDWWGPLTDEEMEVWLAQD
ncbi:MAG: type II toxin-antitoxin system Phd/YefM family antitoxin [Acidobacteria bacterium]|nr:type II toxin-antitoxin system Phd/YefM family antitoxin [Acidobacteriota bacterium]